MTKDGARADVDSEPELTPEPEQAAHHSDQLAIICTLVSVTLATTIAIILICAAIRGATGAHNVAISSVPELFHAKHWDHLLFDTAVVTTFVTTVLLLHGRTRRLITRNLLLPLTIAAILGLSLGICSIEEPQLEAALGLWSGFGLSCFIFVLVASLFIWRMLEWNSIRRPIRWILTTFMGLIVVADMINLYRPAYEVASPDNNEYMLNEMLAPAAGKHPYANFIPLYEGLYGYLLKPLAAHLSAMSITSAACILFSIFSASAVALGVLISYRVLGKRSLVLAAMFVVPLTCITVGHNPLNNLAGAFQYIPIRLFPGMLLAAIGIEELVRVRGGAVGITRIAILGIIGGLVAWNNHDFGIASTVALTILILATCRQYSNGIRFAGSWMAGLLVGILIYPFALFLTGTPLQFNYLFYYQFTFGNGYGAYPVQIPGPVMVVLPLVLITAATGWFFLLNRGIGQRRDIQRDIVADRAAITAAFFGTWMLGCFPYYLNRSIAAGQLQIFLLPCGVAIAALVALAMPYVPQRIDQRRLDGQSRISRHHLMSRFMLLPLTFLAALPFAAILYTANPIKSVEILRSPPPGTGVVWPDTSGVTRAVKIAHRLHASITYYGEWGNYVQLATGVRSVSIVDLPPSVASLDGPDCDYLIRHGTDLLVVGPIARASYGKSICGSYVVTKRDVQPDFLFRRTR